MENRSNNKGIVPLIIGCIIFLAADYFGLWYFLVRVSPKFEETTIELGCEEVSLDADDYLTGLHIFHSDAWVDTSDLNRYVEGTYTVVVYLTDKEYEYTYYVEDTCSPRLEINESFDDCLELGDNYVSAIDRCFDFIYDPSGIVDATLYVDGAEAGTGSITTSGYYTGDEKYVQYARIEESLYENIEGTFDELRSYEISLVVVDGAGNKEGADYTVDVKDTRAPQITTFDEEEQPWFAIGRRYRPEDFVKEIDDASGFWSTAFIIDEEPSAYIEFDDMGEHEVTVYAVDESGNETRLDVTAPFDEPPIFVAVRNRDVLLDSDYDILYHVIAVDNTDGDVTATITVDDDGFDPCKIGTYNVKYTATDSHGLQTEIISELDVGYNYAGDFYLTDEEIDLLCDYDYFEYDILEEEDYNQAIDLIEPAQVNMIYRYSTAYSSGYTAG
ncbi:MAG: hypothetical protein J5367_04580, partial [Lachnospiraceae bacterium]|nr:hypothetical protein [Lachnospiraceae bacterium]